MTRCLKRRLACALVALVLLPPAAASPSRAQNLLSFGGGDQPIEITAEEGIEWRRNEKVYIASGHARAARGDIELYGNILSAYYRDADDGGSEVYRVEAHGNVRILSPNEAVYGDDGYYDVDRGVVALTGKALRLEAGGDSITAKESLEYWEAKRLAVARGGAVASRGDKSLSADLLVGHFRKDDDGRLVLRQVDAQGQVRIKTPTDFVASDSGVYYVDKQFAELTGAVKITRGEAQLNGEYAEVNLATGVSRLLAAPPGGKADTRVHGLFVPAPKPPSDNES
ncbi:MAG TPA: LptA/OstA family protein [Kiloniellales bacterium]